MRSLSLRRKKARIDPAPSRWAWRLERMMLTPGFRLALRAGVPFALTAAFGTWYLADEDRRLAITDKVTELRASIEERPEFMVGLMAVEGAGPDVAAEIREVVPVSFPVSSFDLDLEFLRATIIGLDGVRDATVRIRPGGVLDVHVTERVPVVVWRTYEQVALIDPDGVFVAPVETRLARPDLPLIAGIGADLKVGEALELTRAGQPLGNRMRGLVRMGERRWDVVLDRGQRIMLPEDGAVQALERVIALDRVQQLLDRDVARVDMRLGQRPTVQMNKAATEEWWRIKSFGTIEEQGQ